MARTIFLTLGDTVTANNGGLLGGDAASIVGAGAIWKDDSDGTYADIVTQMHGEGQPQFSSSGSCAITGPASLPTAVKLFARLRVAALETGLPYPTVRISRLNSEVNGSYPGDCPTTPTWVDVPVTGAALATFFAEPTTYSLGVHSGFKTGASGDKHWRVYEARLYVTLLGDDAPPCRIFPRRDGLGVGAGCAFPPPKSQQRSPGNRGVGYY